MAQSRTLWSALHISIKVKYTHEFSFLMLIRSDIEIILERIRFKFGCIFLGESAKLYDQTHPDWAPAIAMGHSSCSVSKSSKVTALNRYQRASERSARRLCLEEVDKENNDPEKRPDNCELQEILCVFNLCKSETEGDEVADLTEDNTDKTSSEIPVGELMTWIEFEMGDNKETEKCKCTRGLSESGEF